MEAENYLKVRKDCCLPFSLSGFLSFLLSLKITRPDVHPQTVSSVLQDKSSVKKNVSQPSKANPSKTWESVLFCVLLPRNQVIAFALLCIPTTTCYRDICTYLFIAFFIHNSYGTESTFYLDVHQFLSGW